MIESTERLRGHEATGRRRSDAQWIEVFAHHFVTQRHSCAASPPAIWSAQRWRTPHDEPAASGQW